MNFEEKKKELIEWLSSVEEEEVLYKIEQVKDGGADWWNDLCDEDKRAIDEGIEQLKNGQYHSHEEFRDRVEKKFSI